MIGALLAALRPVLAMVLIGGAATLMVAPAFDMASQQRAASQAASRGAAPAANQTPPPSDDPDADPNETPMPDFETLLRECLDSHDPDSDACAAAALESGMSYEDFRAKIVAKLEPEKTQKSESKEQPKAEPTRKPEAVVVKKTEPVKTKDDFATWFEKCLNTRDFNSDECLRAEELSGLGTADFEAKFNSKLAAKDGGDFWTWFEKCLDTRDWRSDNCVRAQSLIGFNDADFHSKFERYLAERDAQTAKSGKAAKTAAPAAYKPTLEALLKVCGETHQRTSEACAFALTASGLKPTEFYAKVEARFAPFN